jgi:hypothetical protein
MPSNIWGPSLVSITPWASTPQTRLAVKSPGGVILTTAQCSKGTTQSRPYPARALKLMESAGHHEASRAGRLPSRVLVTHPATISTDGQVPDTASKPSRSHRRCPSVDPFSGAANRHVGRRRWATHLDRLIKRSNASPAAPDLVRKNVCISDKLRRQNYRNPLTRTCIP